MSEEDLEEEETNPPASPMPPLVSVLCDCPVADHLHAHLGDLNNEQGGHLNRRRWQESWRLATEGEVAAWNDYEIWATDRAA